MEDLIDFEKEMERLTKEKQNLEKEIARAGGKLANVNFVNKAPAAVVQEERDKLEKYQTMMDKVMEQISKLQRQL